MHPGGNIRDYARCIPIQWKISRNLNAFFLRDYFTHRDSRRAALLAEFSSFSIRRARIHACSSLVFLSRLGAPLRCAMFTYFARMHAFVA